MAYIEETPCATHTSLRGSTHCNNFSGGERKMVYKMSERILGNNIFVATIRDTLFIIDNASRDTI